MASVPRSGREPCAGSPHRLDAERDEALVGNRNALVGRLGDDCGVGGPAGRDQSAPDARRFLVGDSGDDHVSAQAALLRAGRGQHRRRETRLHVERASAEQLVAADASGERFLHPCNPDGVHMGVQHERPAAAGAARGRDHVGTPRRRLLDLDLEPGALTPVRDEPGQLVLSCSTGYQLRVDGVDADELCGQLGELTQRRRAPRRRARRPERRPSPSAPR